MGEQLVKAVWSREVQGSRMFKVKQKLKWCKESFIRWRKRQKYNTRKDIELILKEMEHIQSQAEPRDWEKWRQLKDRLDVAYKAEEDFWRKKSRIGWLREEDKNTNFFHAATAERRKRNRIEGILTDEEVLYKGEEKVAREVAKHFEKLFTSDQPDGNAEVFEGIPRTTS